MWRFLVKNFMLDLTCLQAHVHTMDVFVYFFIGQYLGSHYKKDCFIYIALNWDLDFLLKHVTAIHIHSCTFMACLDVKKRRGSRVEGERVIQLPCLEVF